MKPVRSAIECNLVASPTSALRTLWLLSVLVFLVNYTFEFLEFNQLYEAQQFLLVLLQLSISLWAFFEWVLLKRSPTDIPLNGLGLVLIAQLLIGLIRLPLGWLMESGLPHVETLPGYLDLGLAVIFIPLNLLLFLLVSKLLINAFSFGERQRSVMLQREIETRLKAEEALQVANTELQRLATTDRLTGVWNRTHLEAILVAELARAERYHQPLSLLIIDVDHFKSINDTLGHLAGDAVLIELTRRIRAQVRSVDVLARWGGEEFVVLLPECGAAEGLMVAEKLRALVADQPCPAVGRVTASFGLAQFQPAETLDSCLHRADEALYAAKQGGRNRVCVATDQGHGCR